MTFVIRWLCRLHDVTTDAGFVVGVLGVSVMTVIYCYEVVTRYFLGIASNWANDTFSNVLCITIFSMVPHVTRARSHIAITILSEFAPRLDRGLRYVIGVVSFTVCILVAWMSLEQNIRQVVYEIVTEQNHPLPRVYMSGFITYGFAGAALYFLRDLFDHDALAPRSWVTRFKRIEAGVG